MFLSDVSIKRPVLATVMSLMLVVLGVIAFTRLTLRELPNIDPPVVSVQVTYPGASAAVVETRITQVLEDAVAGTGRLIETSERNMTTYSGPDSGRTRWRVFFASGLDDAAAGPELDGAINHDAITRGQSRHHFDFALPAFAQRDLCLLDGAIGLGAEDESVLRDLHHGDLWDGDGLPRRQVNAHRHQHAGTQLAVGIGEFGAGRDGARDRIHA